MWNAAHVREIMAGAKHFGFDLDAHGVKFDWPMLKKARDDYVGRLNGIYAKNLANSEVALIQVCVYVKCVYVYVCVFVYVM
jgi:glutathione reductase (NADPH)